jgi:hypothetical protein
MAYYIYLAMWFWLAWATVCVIAAKRKHDYLMDKCSHEWRHGQQRMLQEETGVSVLHHAVKLMFFRNPKVLYGPLVQANWDLNK